jgi:hypothetical protein
VVGGYRPRGPMVPRERVAVARRATAAGTMAGRFSRVGESGARSRSRRRPGAFAIFAAVLPVFAGACRRDVPPPRVRDGAELVDEGVAGASTAHERAESGRADCEATAARVVNGLPEVKRMVASAIRAAGEDDGGARFGGVGPLEDGEGGFASSLGIQSDERFEAQVWWSVDRAGHMSMTILGSDFAVPTPALREVERACKPQPRPVSRPH